MMLSRFVALSVSPPRSRDSSHYFQHRAVQRRVRGQLRRRRRRVRQRAVHQRRGLRRVGQQPRDRAGRVSVRLPARRRGWLLRAGLPQRLRVPVQRGGGELRRRHGRVHQQPVPERRRLLGLDRRPAHCPKPLQLRLRGGLRERCLRAHVRAVARQLHEQHGPVLGAHGRQLRRGPGRVRLVAVSERRRLHRLDRRRFCPAGRVPLRVHRRLVHRGRNRLHGLPRGQALFKRAAPRRPLPRLPARHVRGRAGRRRLHRLRRGQVCA